MQVSNGGSDRHSQLTLTITWSPRTTDHFNKLNSATHVNRLVLPFHQRSGVPPGNEFEIMLVGDRRHSVHEVWRIWLVSFVKLNAICKKLFKSARRQRKQSLYRTVS